MEVVAQTCGGFEGPEKRIEVIFDLNVKREKKTCTSAKPCGMCTAGKVCAKGPRGLRGLQRDVWDKVVGSVNGMILHHTAGEHFDAYVISESSLFVYPSRVVLLTCGTTTLLLALPHILAAAASCDLSPQYIQFSRKNFIFPKAQVAPHTSFQDESEYLGQLYPQGVPFVMGPLHHHHWNAYVVDEAGGSMGSGKDQLLTLYMHGLNPEHAKIFEYGDEEGDAKRVTEESGIGSFVAGAVCDAHCFTPCGYSVNAIVNESYFTMHITPEAHCSYASFETNLPLSNPYPLLHRVLNAFKPRHAQVVIRYQPQSDFGISGKTKKLDASLAHYQIKNFATNEGESGMNFIVTNYSRKA